MSRIRTNPESLPNIKRIDTPAEASKQSHGWQVYISRQGKVYTKHFADSKWGSKRASKQAAIADRDAALAQSPPSLSALGIRTKTRSNTGLLGISESIRKRGTSTFANIVATVRVEAGLASTKTIAFDRTDPKSRKKAIAQAIEWRAQHLERRLTSLGTKGAKQLIANLKS